MANRFGLPNLGTGLGLRTVHYSHILEAQPVVDWFEIISDNYLSTAGRPLEFLEEIAARYPIVMHGVSLSIGSTDPLNVGYVRELRALAERIGARWISDHLCWTGIAGRNTHDLLPMPYTEASLRHVVDRTRAVQDLLGAPLVLENPSTYVEFAGNTMSEWDFLARVADEADCGLLLDVNNVYVSSRNHGFEAMHYLDALPFERVVQVHIAGHTDHGTHIIDSHVGPVVDPVWRLLAVAQARTGGVATLLEWDAEIPSFEETHAEALKARQFIGAAA
jgi:uncharacterized protein